MEFLNVVLSGIFKSSQFMNKMENLKANVYVYIEQFCAILSAGNTVSKLKWGEK